MIIKYMPEYTLHDAEYLFRVLYLMEKLIPEENLNKLSVPELMLLVSLAFFHDVGMSPEESEIKAWRQQWIVVFIQLIVMQVRVKSSKVVFLKIITSLKTRFMKNKYSPAYKHSPAFYNKEAIILYKNLKNDSSGTILKGIGTAKGTGIDFSYKEKRFEWTINDIERSVGSKIFESSFIRRVEVKDDQKGHIYLEGFYARFRGANLIGSMSAIRSKAFRKIGGYYKIVFPVKSTFKFHNIVETFSYNLDNEYFTTTGTIIHLKDESLEVLIDNDESKSQFLVIQSRKKQDLEDFEEKVHKVVVALGYLTGYFAGGESCVFVYSSCKLKSLKGFEYKARRQAVNNIYSPLITNPFAVIGNKRIANSYYKSKKLKVVSIELVSNLCKMIVENEKFFTAIMLLIETSGSNLLLQPVGYSVVLESLRDIISTDFKGQPPITDKKVFRAFRDDVMKVLNRYSEQECITDVKTLTDRIDGLNRVINGEKLSAPFKAVGLNLTPVDLDIINSRNDFLHGRIADYKKQGITRTVDQENDDLHYASLRFYTLLNMLILKYIGFSGYIINYAKLNEKHTGYKVSEKPFISI